MALFGLPVSVPKDAEGYLEAAYGKDWRIPRKGKKLYKPFRHGIDVPDRQSPADRLPERPIRREEIPQPKPRDARHLGEALDHRQSLVCQHQVLAGVPRPAPVDEGLVDHEPHPRFEEKRHILPGDQVTDGVVGITDDREVASRTADRLEKPSRIEAESPLFRQGKDMDLFRRRLWKTCLDLVIIIGPILLKHLQPDLSIMEDCGAASPCAVFNAGMNLLFISRSPVAGAALSTVATEALLTLLSGCRFLRSRRAGKGESLSRKGEKNEQG